MFEFLGGVVVSETPKFIDVRMDSKFFRLDLRKLSSVKEEQAEGRLFEPRATIKSNSQFSRTNAQKGRFSVASYAAQMNLEFGNMMGMESAAGDDFDDAISESSLTSYESDLSLT